MPKIIIANDTLAPDPDSGKSVLFTKTDGLYVVLESGTVVGPLAGPFSMVAGGALTGTYPNPGLANNAVTTTKIANGAVTGAKLDPTLIDPVAGTAGLRTLGTGAQQAAAGNDPRLSDSRAPSGVASGDLAGSYPAPVVGRLRGRLVSTAVPALNDVLTWNGTAWTPAASGGGGGITELQFAFDAAATGASPLVVGSVYLSSGTTIGAASRAMIGGSLAGETALLQLRRFTGGALLAQFAPGAGTLQDVPVSGGPVSVTTSDWYDLYLSETGGGTALAKGLQLVLS